MGTHPGPTTGPPLRIILFILQLLEDHFLIIPLLLLLFGGLGWVLFLLKSLGWF